MARSHGANNGLVPAALRRWRYRLEKGHPHLVLLFGVVVTIVAISVVGGVVVYLFGVNDSLPQSMWWVFLRLSDPGYLGDDTTVTSAFFGTAFTIAGMLVVMAGLVAVLTSLTVSGLQNLREGGADVAFTNHTVIVGWNTKIYALVQELLEAEPHAEIAILAEREKQDADRELEKRVLWPVRPGRRRPERWHHHVVYRKGDPLVQRDLTRVGAGRAQRFILLAEQGQRGVEADVRTLRTFLSVDHAQADARGHPDDRNGAGASTTNVIIEMTAERLRGHMFLAADLDPLTDAWVAYYEQNKRDAGEPVFLPRPASFSSHDDLTLVNEDQLISRAIVQCAVQPFMSRVYDELLSFKGKEFFLLEHATDLAGSDWVQVLDDTKTLKPEELPAHFARHVTGAMMVGVYEQTAGGAGTMLFDPAQWTDKLADHPLVILGEGRTSSDGLAGVRIRREPLPASRHDGQRTAPGPTMGDRFRVLMLGYNRRVSVMVEQFARFSNQSADTALSLTLVAPDLPVERMGREFARYGPAFEQAEERHILQRDFSDWDVLGRLLRDEEPFDSILLVAEDRDLDGEVADARVILGLIMLRAFRADPQWASRLANTTVVAEILDPQNREIAEREDWVTDVIVSNEYVSRFMAQVAVDSRLEEIYREILDYGNREIYKRTAAELGVGPGARFLDVISAAARHGEVAIGYFRRSSPTDPLDVVLAPDADEPLQNPEFFLSVAEES